MILFYGEGRLGNQVFQYHALSRLDGEFQHVLAVGLEDLGSVFELRGPRVSVITRSGLLKRCFKYLVLPLFLRPLARTLRFMNYVCEPAAGTPPRVGSSGQMRLQKGLCRWLTFVDGGYYQNGSFCAAKFPTALLELRSEYRNRACEFLERALGGSGKIPVFVHVRRGDYLSFASYGLDNLTLPESYYREGMRAATKRVGRPHFVFVTDDRSWVEATFHDVLNKSVASFDQNVDFALMAECPVGILSNSTFSLAAALLIPHPEVIFGPRFWFGFRINEWYPPSIRIDHPKVVYLDVLPVGAA